MNLALFVVILVFVALVFFLLIVDFIIDLLDYDCYSDLF